MTATQPRRYAGQSAEQRDSERLRRLRTAALELFGTEGYTAVSVERVCTEAKVSTRHYYQLFGNKEDLLIDLYGAITNEAFAAVGRSLEATSGQHIVERLEVAIGAYLAPILADPRAAKVAFVEIVGVSPRVESTRLGFRDGIIALIERESHEAVKRGEVTIRDFRFLGLAFLGAVNVVVHDWSLHADRTGHEAADELQRRLTNLAIELLTREPA